MDADWFAPRPRSTATTATSCTLVFPTIKHLESLLPYKSSAEALDDAADREIEPVMPTVEGEGSERRIVMPDGWDDVPLPPE